MRARRTSGPRAYGAWRASHAMLWGRCAGGAHDLVQEMQEIQEVQERPCGASQTVLQSGGGRRPRGPMRPIGPTASPLGTSQTCRGCRGDWKLGSLEVWRLGFLGGAPPHTPTIPPSPVYVLRSLFSVLRGGISRPSPAGVWGSAPYPSICQSANQPIPLCPLWAFVLFVVKKLAVLRVFVEMGFHKKTPGAMPSGVGSLVCCARSHIGWKNPISELAWGSAWRAGWPARSGSSPCPRGSCPCCRAPGTNGRSRWRRRSA